jgi:tetratricopeptide (TPR) repeat protein
MSNVGNIRNIAGVTLAVVLAAGWGFQSQLKEIVTGSVPPSLGREGMSIMASGADDAEKRKEARNLFTRALKGDSRDPLAQFGLGWVEQLDGNRDSAKGLYAGAIRELQDVLQAARYNQSLILEDAGELRAAYEEIRLLLRLDPQNEKARARQEDLIKKLGAQNNQGQG